MRKGQLWFFLLLGCAGVQAQQCMPTSGTSSGGASSSNLSNIEIGSMSPSADGLIHVTYSFDGTVDANTQKLFNNAAQQWNGDLGQTGVVFDKVASGGIIPIGRNDNATNCISINAQTGPLNFNGQWLQLASNNPTVATAAAAHELGHFVGMDDAGPNPSQPTIMNNPNNGSCANAQVNTTVVQFNDAKAASGCTSQAQSVQNPLPPPPHQRPCLVDGNPCDPCDPDCTPIILDTEGEGFHLTSAEGGVMFDISGNGQPVQIAWTNPRFHNAFLSLPGRDGLVHDGKELFGNFTPQPQSAHPNGFLALAEFDKIENGGNGDGIIDEHDQVFSQLRLWIDENHDGVCQPNELHRLPELGVYSLALSYKESRRSDQFGNQFRYKAIVNPGDSQDSRDERPHGENSEVGRWTYDVFFVIK